MRREKEYNAVKRMLRYLLMMTMIIIVTVLTACSSNEPTDQDDAIPPYSEESVETQQETIPPVQISMPEYELTYSGELADVIATREYPEDNSLEFIAKLSEEEATIFILHFNKAEGELVQMLTDAQGDRIPVAFEMMVLPEGLSDGDADLFYMAQDAVNEIIASLKLK